MKKPGPGELYEGAYLLYQTVDLVLVSSIKSGFKRACLLHG